MKQIMLVPCLGALVGCGVMPTKHPTAQGFFTTDSAEFAIFAEAGQASAIRIGATSQEQMTERAIAAIKRATGCAIVPGTVTKDQKSVRARYVC
ncbi:MAG: hypothetical protein AAF393_01220 [Pseudomonadota bacterium]